MHLKSETVFMFPILINSNHSHQKKNDYTCLSFFFQREELKHLKLALLHNIYFFQWICFSQGSVPILQMQVVHTAHYHMCRMIQRTAWDQDIILAFSKDHSSMLRSSNLVHACLFGKLHPLVAAVTIPWKSQISVAEG